MCCHITTGKQNHIGCVQLRGKMHYIDLIRCDCVYAWELNLLQTKIYNRNGENFIVFTATSNDIPHMKKRLKMDQLSWFNDLGMWDCLKQQQFTGGQNLCQICFSWTAPWHVEECYMAWVPTLPVGSGPCQTGAACLGTGHSDRSQMPFMWQHQAPWPFSLTLWEGRSQASMLPELGGHANFLSQNASPYQLPPPPTKPHTCLIEACKRLGLSLCCLAQLSPLQWPAVGKDFFPYYLYQQLQQPCEPLWASVDFKSSLL